MKPTARKLLTLSVSALLAGFVMVNLVARNQARAMTEFLESGVRTQKPEDLSPWEKAKIIFSGVTVPRPRNSKTPADFGLPYEEVSFPNGVGDTISAWVIGAESPVAVVLLFHGYAASKDSLLPTAAALRDLGAASLLVDFYGSGDSTGSGTSIGVREAHDVAASLVLARERWPDSRVVLYGISMGGAAILRAVAVEAVAPDAIIVESVFDRLVNAAGMRFTAMGLPPRPLADRLLFWGGRHWGFDAFSHNPSDYARSVYCPALLIFGDSDARVGKDQAVAIHQNLTGSKSLVIIPGMGHQTAITAAPETWNREVAAFLSAQ